MHPMTPRQIEELSEKIANWIVKDLSGISWVDMYIGFVFGYIFAHSF